MAARLLTLLGGSAFLLASVGAVSLPLPTLDLSNATDIHTTFDLGKAHGVAFKSQIKKRMECAQMKNQLLPFVRTTAGAAVLKRFQHTHQTTFPSYMEELRGVAEGSGFPFETIFVSNLREEISYFLNQGDLGKPSPDVEHCSDYFVADAAEKTQFLCHNEDSGVDDLNATFMLTTPRGGLSSSFDFTAYTYAGDLPSGAFGWNDAGLAFTLDYTHPVAPDEDGVGRAFVSRSLLDAKGFEDAVEIVTTRYRLIGGHNYQLLSFADGRAANVEAASGKGSFHVRTLAGPMASPPVLNGGAAITHMYHANEYLYLNVSQSPSKDSDWRMQRAATFAIPASRDEVVQIMGDTLTAEWAGNVSIYQQGAAVGDTGYTMHTVFFDMVARTVTAFQGNPKRQSEVFSCAQEACGEAFK